MFDRILTVLSSVGPEPERIMIAERGCDVASSRQALQEKGIASCIPSSRGGKLPYSYDKTLYNKQHRSENLFAKLQNWRRLAPCCDRCAYAFFPLLAVLPPLLVGFA